MKHHQQICPSESSDSKCSAALQYNVCTSSCYSLRNLRNTVSKHEFIYNSYSRDFGKLYSGHEILANNLLSTASFMQVLKLVVFVNVYHLLETSLVIRTQLLVILNRKLFSKLLNYYTNYCTYIKFIKFTH